MDFGDGWLIRSPMELLAGEFLCLSPSGLCWLFCGATETDRELEGWHGEEDHTNNAGELKAMLVAHLFIRLDTRLHLNGCETYRM